MAMMDEVLALLNWVVSLLRGEEGALLGRYDPGSSSLKAITCTTTSYEHA